MGKFCVYTKGISYQFSLDWETRYSTTDYYAQSIFISKTLMGVESAIKILFPILSHFIYNKI